MNQDAPTTSRPAVDLKDPSWYQAASLGERLELPMMANGLGTARVDAERGRRRLERWRRESVFSEPGSFSERLAMDGISEDDLELLLGESPKALQERFLAPPDWLKGLNEALFATSAFERTTLPELPAGDGTEQLLYVVEPLLSHALARLRRGYEEVAQNGDGAILNYPRVEEALFADLTGQLLWRLNRTMVLELNVARIQGCLEGDTPEERFRSFVERLRNREVAQDILREYPVLTRQVLLSTDQWVNSALELLRRLHEDWDDIKRTFWSSRVPGELVHVEGGEGDRHRDGRSVHILTFSSGLKLVYKPRSLATDLHFQELLAWTNARGSHPPFKTLVMLDRGSHGWVEYVEGRGCKTREGVKRFYKRQGGYLALLYALNATDFHSENLIASGENPVLVDLEALFHPDVNQNNPAQSAVLADVALNSSVARVGLLPSRVVFDPDNAEGNDLSGLGGGTVQLSPYRLPSWEKAATDEMRLVRERLEMPGNQNRPSLNGMEVDVHEHVDDVLGGFVEVYQALVRHRGELLADDGPLARFAEDEVRYIARATMVYGARLYESFHPDLLRDALNRDRMLDNLWLSKESDPKLSRLVPYEREDLYRADIPLFTA